MWIFGYGSLVWKVDFPYIKKVIGYIKGYERKFFQASIDHRGVPEKPGRVVTLVKSSNTEAKVWGAAYKIHESNVADVIEQLDLREVMGYEKVPIEFYPLLNHPLNIMDQIITSPSSDLTPEDGATTSGRIIETKKDVNINGLSGHHSEDNFSTRTGGQIQKESHKVGIPFQVTMYYGSEENEHFIGPAELDVMAQQIFDSTGPSGSNKDYLFRLADSMRQISDEAIDNHLAELEEAVRDIESLCNRRSPGTPIEL